MLVKAWVLVMACSLLRPTCLGKCLADAEAPFNILGDLWKFGGAGRVSSSVNLGQNWQLAVISIQCVCIVSHWSNKTLFCT